LAHLGVTEFILVDFDVVEESNLNRLVGADRRDIGKPKVLVAQRMIMAINPVAKITAIRGDVVDADVVSRLEGSDLLFLCTDSHASRAVGNQFAYQHLIPAIDMGVSITVTNDVVSHITGRIQMLAPGLPCLVCTDALDGQQIRQELQTPEQRAADPYFQGAHVPQPAVISLNTTVASLAVTMFLGCVTSVPAVARFQYYDGIKGAVRPTTAQKSPNCIICSSQGALARGETVGLPTRNRRSHPAP
jgi:molybdopterin/thiamine biosynthesis adenylyltransferase